jgi:hypothetical protein
MKYICLKEQFSRKPTDYIEKKSCAQLRLLINKLLFCLSLMCAKRAVCAMEMDVVIVDP